MFLGSDNLHQQAIEAIFRDLGIVEYLFNRDSVRGSLPNGYMFEMRYSILDEHYTISFPDETESEYGAILGTQTLGKIDDIENILNEALLLPCRFFVFTRKEAFIGAVEYLLKLTSIIKTAGMTSRMKLYPSIGQTEHGSDKAGIFRVLNYAIGSCSTGLASVTLNIHTTNHEVYLHYCTPEEASTLNCDITNDAETFIIQDNYITNSRVARRFYDIGN